MTRFNNSFIRLFFLLLAGFESVNGTADEIRWQFQKGEKYRISVSQKTAMQSRVNRTKVDVQLDLDTEMDWEILSVMANGHAVIEQSFSRMAVKVVKTAKSTIVYDTASKEPPAKNARYFSEVYDKLVGIKFKVEMTDRGEIKDVVLQKKDMETIRGIPESMEARKLFEKRGLMEILNSGGFVLPEKSIVKGFQWPVKKQQKMTFGTAHFESIFTYEGTSEPTGIARFLLAASAKLQDQPENPSEKRLVLKSQQQTGSIAFDTNHGHLQSIKVNQEMATEKPFREMTIETTSSLESQLTIEKK